MSVADESPRVKRRRYDAESRRFAAERRRTAILDVAWDCFARDGFAATTVEAIAGAAGVSSASIYKTLGGKTGLVRALVERALRGDPAEATAAEVRSERSRLEANDGRELVERWGELMREVSPRVSPIVLLLRDVSVVDVDAAGLFAEVESDRLRRMAANARVLARRGWLRPGVSVTRARDVMWAMTAPDLYDVLVRRRGWSVARYVAFIRETLVAQLL